MTKTMSIRMDRENFEFLNELIKEQRSDLSKAVRDMVTRGRVLLAVERYKKGEASLGRAAELAGVPVGQMMTILTEFRMPGKVRTDPSSGGAKRRSPLGGGLCQLTLWPFRTSNSICASLSGRLVPATVLFRGKSNT